MQPEHITGFIFAGLSLANLVGCSEAPLMPDAGVSIVDLGSPDAGPSGDLGSAPDAGPGPDTGPPPENTLAWAECPWISNPQPGELNISGRCGTFSVPLDHETPFGRRIDLQIRRLDPTATAAIDLWMMNGGPGGSASVFERPTASLSQAWGNVRVYLFDARGAGRSSRLSCAAEAPDSPGGGAVLLEEWDDCLAEAQAEWGDGFDKFDTTSAARDLVAAVQATRQPGVPVFVYGVSYGTFWLQRALQVDPEAFDGVILDSIVNPASPGLARIDEWHDDVGRAYLSLCGADPFCMSKLGPDPVGAAQTLFEMMDDGHCSEISAPGYRGRDLLRLTFGALISNTTVRALIPAMIYRALRCSADDVSAMIRVINFALGGGGGAGMDSGPLLFSQLLSRHVVFSELWGPPPNPQELIDFPERALVSKDIGPAFAPLYESWPRYGLDGFAGQWPSTSTPMLMLNGTLDPQTPIEFAQAAADVYTNPAQTFVTMPYVSHGALLSSQVQGRQTTCGVLVLTQFLRNPTAQLDLSCLEDMVALDFELNINFSRALLGTDDLYE